MALTYCRRIYLLLSKNNIKNVVLMQENKIQNFLPIVYYCKSTSSPNSTDSKIKKSVKAYLENIAQSNEFMEQQLKEFERGKEFLASMMGKNSKTMTQEEIDSAIEYLFPSGLFVPRARPLMKPPNEINNMMPVREVDDNGRPYHYLFYTLKPNFSECLHEAAETLNKLNNLLHTKETTNPKPLTLVGGRWFNKEELSEKFGEKIFDIEYNKFVEIFKALENHPFAIEAKDFIKSYWKSTESKMEDKLLPKVFTVDNVTVSIIEG